MNDDNIEVQVYHIKPIENGFQLTINVTGMHMHVAGYKEKVWSFRNWGELVEFIDLNPPKHMERIQSGTFVELEYDPETFDVSDAKAVA